MDTVLATLNSSDDVSPCHQVFANQDILRQLFEDNFIMYAPTVFTARDMARFARVNRAFHGPATSVLWAELHSIRPLIRLVAPPVEFPFYTGQFAQKHNLKQVRCCITAALMNDGLMQSYLAGVSSTAF